MARNGEKIVIQGIQELKEHLLEITLQEKYMGEKIPEAWLNLETKMTR